MLRVVAPNKYYLLSGINNNKKKLWEIVQCCATFNKNKFSVLL